MTSSVCPRLIGRPDWYVAPRNDPTIAAVKETGKLKEVKPSVTRIDATRVIARVVKEAVGERNPSRLLNIFGPSTKTPARSPTTAVRSAPLKVSVPEPLMLPMRKALLFQPKRNVSAAAGASNGLTIPFRYEDEDDIAGVFGVVRYVIRNEDEVAQLDHGHGVESGGALEQLPEQDVLPRIRGLLEFLDAVHSRQNLLLAYLEGGDQIFE